MSYILQSALPVCDWEVVVVEPGVAVCVVAAPLRFPDVHVWVDVNVLGQRDGSDVVPDLEARGVFVEGWVLCDDLVGYFCAVLVMSVFAPSSCRGRSRSCLPVLIAQSINHRNLQPHIHTIALINLINHLNSISQSDKIESHALHLTQNILDARPL